MIRIIETLNALLILVKGLLGTRLWAGSFNPIIGLCILELNLHRLSLRVFSFNDRAVKLYKSLGFQHEGTCKEAIFRNGTWHDIELFALFQRIIIKALRSPRKAFFIYYRPACSFKAAALSVRSHDRSTSVRPKWP